jgi:hypothetical protein
MNTAVLEAEMRRALINLGQDLFVAVYQMIGAELIRRDGAGCYCPDPDGELAFITAVRRESPDSPQAIEPWAAVCGGGLIDLIAWDPLQPDRWALRDGNADCLGCTEVQDYPELVEPGPTQLWRTPLDWFRGDGFGLVLLSRGRWEQYRVLSQLHGGIDTQDDAHAREVRAILKRPWPAPPVRVAQRTTSQRPTRRSARANQSACIRGAATALRDAQ